MEEEHGDICKGTYEEVRKHELPEDASIISSYASFKMSKDETGD